MVAIHSSILRTSSLRSTRSTTSNKSDIKNGLSVNQKIKKNSAAIQTNKPTLSNRRQKASLALSPARSTSKKVVSDYSSRIKNIDKKDTSYPTPPTSSSFSPNNKNLNLEKKETVKDKVLVKKKFTFDQKAVKNTESCSCLSAPKKGRPFKNPTRCTYCTNKKAGKKEKPTNTAQTLRALHNNKIKVSQVKTDLRSSRVSNKKNNISQSTKAVMSSPTSKKKISTASKKEVKALNHKVVVSLPKKIFIVSKTPKTLDSSYIKEKKPQSSNIKSSQRNSSPPLPLTQKKVPTLSEYEIKRLEMINQNRLFMESLNLGGGPGLSLKAISTPSLPKPATKYIKPPSSKKKTSVIDLTPRKSKRLQGKTAPVYDLPEDFEPVKRSKGIPTKLDTSKKIKAYIRGQKKNGNRAKRQAPQELDPDIKLHNIQKSQEESYSKKPIPEEEPIDVSSLKGFSLAVHHINTCLDDITLEDDFDAQIISRLSNIRQVTSKPIKLIGPIPTTLDVHSDPQRFVVAMGNRAGEVAVWDATNAVLSESDECINPNGYLHEGASIMHHQAYEDRVWSLKFQPEYSAKLLQAGGDGSLRSFDIVKEYLSPVCQLPLHGEFMTGLGFVNPQTVAFTTSHGFFGKHDLRTSSHALNLSALNDTAHLLWCLSVNPANQHIIAVGSSERTLSIWDTRYLTKSESKPITSLQYTAYVTSVDWDPRGKRLAVFAYDDVLRVFDSSNIIGSPTAVENSTVEHTIVETAQYSHDADPWRKGVSVQARFHPDPNLDGRVVVTGAMGPKVNYYNSTSNRSFGYFNARHYPAASPGILAFHPKASLGSHPFGSGMVNGTLSGRAFILI